MKSANVESRNTYFKPKNAYLQVINPSLQTRNPEDDPGGRTTIPSSGASSGVPFLAVATSTSRRTARRTETPGGRGAKPYVTVIVTPRPPGRPPGNGVHYQHFPSGFHVASPNLRHLWSPSSGTRRTAKSRTEKNLLEVVLE